MKDRPNWGATFNQNYSLDGELKEFRKKLLWVVLGLVVCALQFTSKTFHWTNLLAVLVNAFSAELWGDMALDHYLRYRTIKALGEAHERTKEEDSELEIDEKELNELKKITGME